MRSEIISKIYLLYNMSYLKQNGKKRKKKKEEEQEEGEEQEDGRNMSCVLFSTTVTSKIEEKEKVKNDIVKRQKQTISIHFALYVCRSVGRSSDFFSFAYPFSPSLSLCFSCSRRAKYTEKKGQKRKRNDRKGRRRRRFQCRCVRTSKKKGEK